MLRLSKRSKKHPEGLVRHGLWKFYHCRGQFTVRKGTVFESRHLKLHQWFQATYLLCFSKKGCSINQIARTLGITALIVLPQTTPDIKVRAVRFSVEEDVGYIKINSFTERTGNDGVGSVSLLEREADFQMPDAATASNRSDC